MEERIVTIIGKGEMISVDAKGFNNAAEIVGFIELGKFHFMTAELEEVIEEEEKQKECDA